MTKLVVKKPVLSEKAYALSEERRTYVFAVAKDASSHEVAKAIEKFYKVKPKAVRIAKVNGKSQRSIRRSGRSMKTYQKSGFSKAYVTLQEGDSLPIFAAIEEASKKMEEKS